MSTSIRLTAIHDYNGREIQLQMITDAQFALLGSLGARAQNENLPPNDRFKATGQMMAILLSMIVADSDKQFIEDEITAGNLDLGGMTRFIETFSDVKVEPKTRVSRARTAKK